MTMDDFTYMGPGDKVQKLVSDQVNQCKIIHIQNTAMTLQLWDPVRMAACHVGALSSEIVRQSPIGNAHIRNVDILRIIFHRFMGVRQTLLGPHRGDLIRGLRKGGTKEVSTFRKAGYIDDHGFELELDGTVESCTTRMHDAILHVLFTLMRYAGMEVRKEPTGIFTHRIRQQSRDDYAEAEAADSREGLRPDLIFREPANASNNSWGRGREILFDLKTLQAGSTPYQVGASRAWKPAQQVEARANQVPARYQKKAKDADTRYNGLPEDRTYAGPVARELAQYKVIGLAVGAYGEVSKSVHRLMDMISERLAGKEGNQLGLLRVESDSWDAKLAFAKQYVRREISSCIARERAYCMLSRFRRHSSRADANLRHVADAALGDLRSEPDLSPWICGD
jgi:hypothetical protein